MFKRKMIFSLLMVALFGVSTTLLTATEESITLKPYSNDEYIKYNTNGGDFLSNNFIYRLPISTFKLTASLSPDEDTSTKDERAIDHFMSIYSSLFGFIGDFFNDASILITKLMIDGEKYIKTDEIYQCTAPLPTAFLPSILGPLTQLKHT